MTKQKSTEQDVIEWVGKAIDSCTNTVQLEASLKLIQFHSEKYNPDCLHPDLIAKYLIKMAFIEIK